MDNIFRNLKTTLPGLVGGVVACLVVFFPSNSEAINQLGQGVIIVCAALVALFAKDGDKSGTAASPNP